MKAIILISTVMLFLSSCNQEETIATSDLNGKWLCYADLIPSDSLNRPLVIKFNKTGRYHVSFVDDSLAENKVSDGYFLVQKNALHLNLSNSFDTTNIFPEYKFNHQKLKLVEANNTMGLQIKVNDLWYFFEKVH